MRLLKPIKKSVKSKSPTRKLMKRRKNETLRRRRRRFSLIQKPSKMEIEFSPSTVSSPSPMSSSSYDTTLEEDNTVSRRNKAAAIIRRNVNKTRKILIPKVRAKYLNTICSDSGICIAFGKERSKIKKHFDGFVNFSQMSGFAKKIGENSKNGFILEVPYSHEEYKSHAILKSSLIRMDPKKNTPDNLVYEWFVGQKLNELGNYFPCLIETYDLLKYRSRLDYHKAYASKTIEDLGKMIEKVNYKNNMKTLLTESCQYPSQHCLLIQHISGAFTLTDVLLNNKFIDEEEVVMILFQIYFFYTSVVMNSHITIFIQEMLWCTNHFPMKKLNIHTIWILHLSHFTVVTL